MHTYSCKQKIEITVDESCVEELADYLIEAFTDGEFETDKNTIIYTEIGSVDYYPGCYTMPNGDPGYPDETEEHFEVCTDDLEDAIDSWIGEKEVDYYIGEPDYETIYDD